MERFRIERVAESESYMLQVSDNGLSGKYIINSRGHLYIRGGGIFNIDEQPPTRQEFNEMIGSVIACSPAQRCKARKVFRALREYTCD